MIDVLYLNFYNHKNNCYRIRSLTMSTYFNKKQDFTFECTQYYQLIPHM